MTCAVAFQPARLADGRRPGRTGARMEVPPFSGRRAAEGTERGSRSRHEEPSHERLSLRGFRSIFEESWSWLTVPFTDSTLGAATRMSQSRFRSASLVRLPRTARLRIE